MPPLQLEPVDHDPWASGEASGMPGGELQTAPPTDFASRINQTLKAVGEYHGEKFADMLRGIYNTTSFPGRVLFEGYRPTQEEATEQGIAAGTMLVAPSGFLRPRPGVLSASPGTVRDVPGLYSAVENAVQNQATRAAPGDQWLSTIKNAPGVKAEELDWLGLEDALKGKPSVSKEDVLNHINSQKVNLKEHINTNIDEQSEPAFEHWQDLAGEIYDHLESSKPKDVKVVPQQGGLYYDVKVGDRTIARHTTEDIAKSQARDLKNDIKEHIEGGPQTLEDDALHDWASEAVEWHPRRNDVPEGTPMGRYAEYTMPGGENYREFLLQEPNIINRGADPKIVALRQFSDQMAQKYGTGWGNKISPEETLKHRELHEAAMMSGEVASKDVGYGQKEFMSNHWDEPNILAHVRTKDRTIDGKKTLFIEEVQSDWHQQGRKRGYGVGKDSVKDLKSQGYTAEPVWRNPYEERNAIDEAGNHRYRPTSWRIRDAGGVPQGRVNLRTVAREVLGDRPINDNEALTGDHALRAYANNLPGRVPDAPFKNVNAWTSLAMKRMMRVAAEEGYDQIAWAPGQVHVNRYPGAPGVEGNLEFYDKVLPNVANKIGSKYDARVSRVRMEHAHENEFAPIESRDQAINVLNSRPHAPPEAPKGILGITRDGRTKEVNTVAELEKAEKELGEKFDSFAWQPTYHHVHVMPITDKLRDTAMGKGFPMFSGGMMLMPVDHDPFGGDNEHR